MHKITPFLWFDNQAEEAARFYVSVFKNSKMGDVAHLPDGSPSPVPVITVEFELDGQPFIALNAGPEFKFNEAVSFVVDCHTQEEVDYYWNTLTADGGQESMCGWLKDKYGLSWQIVPRQLNELLSDPDPGRAKRAIDAMLKMQKIDVAALQAAADQE